MSAMITLIVDAVDRGLWVDLCNVSSSYSSSASFPTLLGRYALYVYNNTIKSLF